MDRKSGQPDAPGGGFTAATGGFASNCPDNGGIGGNQTKPGAGGICDPYEPGAPGSGMQGGAPSNTGSFGGGGGGGGSGWFGGGAGGIDDNSTTYGGGGGGGSDYASPDVRVLSDLPGGNTLTGGQPSDGGAVLLTW